MVNSPLLLTYYRRVFDPSDPSHSGHQSEALCLVPSGLSPCLPAVTAALSHSAGPGVPHMSQVRSFVLSGFRLWSLRAVSRACPWEDTHSLQGFVLLRLCPLPLPICRPPGPGIVLAFSRGPQHCPGENPLSAMASGPCEGTSQPLPPSMVSDSVSQRFPFLVGFGQKKNAKSEKYGKRQVQYS